MKKLVVIMTAVMTAFASPDSGELTKKERKFAYKYLETSMDAMFRGIENLTEDQWNFEPADGGWSVAGTCEHLLIAERGFLSLIPQTILENEANKAAPDQPVTDDEVISFIKDRSPARRVKTAPGFEPTGALANPAEFMKKYKEARQKLIEFTKTSDAALKSYYFQSPAGKISAYQWLLLASAHTERHFGQMEEVMAETGFPK